MGTPLQAPLLIGCDVVNMDNDTFRILTNEEIIAVNQDPLGKSGRRVARDGNKEVWAGPLSDQSVAVVLLNTGPNTTIITANWTDLSLGSGQSAKVRDLWAQEDLGIYKGSVEVTVPSHAVAMYRITPQM